MISVHSLRHFDPLVFRLALVFVLLIQLVIPCLPEVATAQDFDAFQVRLGTEASYEAGTIVDNPQVGQSLYPQFRYNLSGPIPSSPVLVQIKRDNEPPCTYTQSQFTPGEYRMWCNDPWVVTAGEHTFVGTVDVNNSYTETNEDNNSASRTYNVSGSSGTTTPTPVPTSSPTPTPTLSGCEERVADGGFEAGPPHSAWTQTSTLFPAVIYQDGLNVPSPHSGQYLCWFGGSTQGQETGTLEQTVTIPAGNAELSYYLKIYALGPDTDFMRVLLDGNELVKYTPADEAEFTAYKRAAHDVTAYADGGQHVLRFESTVAGMAGEYTNFLLDDISLVSCTPGESLAMALFQFAQQWMDGTHQASELLALLGGEPTVSATATPTSTQETEPSTPTPTWTSHVEPPTATPTMTEGAPTPTPTQGSGTFDFKDFFIETAGSNWHYTGVDPPSQEDDFRWTVLATRYDVGGGKDAAQLQTDTDEPTDARNGDIDLWRVESNGDVVFYGIIRANDRQYSGITIPAQPIVLPDPILVGRDGLSIGDEVTDSKSGSMDVIVPILGTQTLTGTFNSSVKFTEFMPTFATPLGTFTNVLRVVIEIQVTVNIPFVGSKDFEFTNSTFFFKQGVGMVGQDQDPDPDDAQKQVIEEGTVYVGGSPVTVVAN
jgi:hypothetical protein